MSDILKKIENTGIIPVIKLDSEEQAVPLAKALLDGGINAAEVTFRTDAAFGSIKAIRKTYPEMLVGAGTVINVSLAQKALEAGAQFIVSPGFNPNVVDFCIKNNIPVIPGINSPSQIEAALEKGLSVLKFFPAEASGGVSMIKALSGPFPQVKFMATGGINAKNMSEYFKCKNIIAIGGSWMVCDDLDKVCALSREAVASMNGFTFAHLGINAANAEESLRIKGLFELLGFSSRETSVSWFNEGSADAASFETMKAPGYGSFGHIAIKTWNIERALAYLERFGIVPDMSTAKYTGVEGKSPLKLVYINMPISGFAVHLLRA